MARIVIVGAGPAGSSAGWHLASRGHDVTLVDRAAFPRPKTCGDWITLASVSELARMGLSRQVLESQGSYAPISHTVIVAPSGRETMSEQSEQAYCIPRLMFDDMLWRHAVDAGCKPIRRAVRDIPADPELAGRFDHVIDARGAHAGDANAVALRAYWTVPRALLRNREDTAVQIHTDAAYGRGYGWLFPVSADRERVCFNIGVGLWKADSVTGHSVADFFERFVSSNSALQRWRPGAETTRPVGCHVGLGLARNNVAQQEILRIGDAANLADPLTGDGIGNALASGRLVAEAIDGSATAAEAGLAWQYLHDAVIAPELRRALAIRHALVSATGKNIAARVLSGAPFLKRRVHAAFFGERPYRGLMLGGSRMSHL